MAGKQKIASKIAGYSAENRHFASAWAK